MFTLLVAIQPNGISRLTTSIVKFATSLLILLIAQPHKLRVFIGRLLKVSHTLHTSVIGGCLRREKLQGNVADSFMIATSLQNIEIVMTTDPGTTQVGICKSEVLCYLCTLFNPNEITNFAL